MRSMHPKFVPDVQQQSEVNALTSLSSESTPESEMSSPPSPSYSHNASDYNDHNSADGSELLPGSDSDIYMPFDGEEYQHLPVNDGNESPEPEPSIAGSYDPPASEVHDPVVPPLAACTRTYHPIINGKICDENGNDIPPDSDPPPLQFDRGPHDWTPYNNRIEFEVADFLYCRNQMSAGDIDTIFRLWAASLAAHHDSPPFSNHTEMYNVIDSTPLVDLPWQSFSLEYNGDVPEEDVPSWMSAEYDVWFRDPLELVHKILSNPDFEDEIDYAPVQEYSSDGVHRFQNFMSGNWAWKQAVSILLVFHFSFLNFPRI